MAILNNGLETMELGATAWRIIINDNFSKIYAKNELYTKNESDERYAPKDGSETLNFTVKDIDIKGLMKFNSTLPTMPLPDAPKGYIKAVVNGENVKIAYYGDE
ncbi:MAG: hypothetical protein MR902_07510 [Campylobacter sp.]|nr:hypothetical protein [Campylobacter sp.]